MDRSQLQQLSQQLADIEQFALILEKRYAGLIQATDPRVHDSARNLLHYLALSGYQRLSGSTFGTGNFFFAACRRPRAGQYPGRANHTAPLSGKNLRLTSGLGLYCPGASVSEKASGSLAGAGANP